MCRTPEGGGGQSHSRQGLDDELGGQLGALKLQLPQPHQDVKEVVLEGQRLCMGKHGERGRKALVQGSK